MKPSSFRKRIDEVGTLLAAQEVFSGVNTQEEADARIWQYVGQLLDNDNYVGAAWILWGPRLFNSGPQSVKDIWRVIREHSMILLQGAGGVGKTLTPVCYLLLDWIRDPEYTNIKFVSATKKHASSNAWSDLVRMHGSACVKLPGDFTGGYLGIDPKNRKAGIEIIAIPVGSDGRGRLQGFHPHPRKTPHPKLGESSRVRLYMDECITIPIGVWEGVDNLKTSISGNDTIKIIGSYNPKDQTSVTANNSEPKDGWEAVDPERGVRGSNEWISKEGWYVLRIDGKRNENVVTGKCIYTGMITREGFRLLEQKHGGNSIDLWVFGRGMFPPEGSVGAIISQKLWESCLGEFIFAGPTTRHAGDDLAFNGGDNHILTVGRIGLASAFKHKSGEITKFREARQVLQIDQQYQLKKGDVKAVGLDAKEKCTQLNVSPENYCCDSTGKGESVYAYLRTIWSDDVQGINYSAAASTIKILQEDTRTPEELYEGMVSELWFALAKWMEFGYVAFAPGIRKDPLSRELCGRHYVIGAGKKLRVEKKDDYKRRLSADSPDWADSATLILAGARYRGAMMGSMVDEVKPPPEEEFNSPLDEIQWLEEESGV